SRKRCFVPTRRDGKERFCSVFYDAGDERPMKPGIRLKSAVCDTEVMVIRGSNVVVECGGAAMTQERAAERGAIDTNFAGGTQMGKRYVDAAGTIELL